MLKEANAIVRYYHATRQEGHTEANISAARDIDCWVVTSSRKSATELSERFGVPIEKFVVPSDFDTKCLGTTKPLIFDNHTIIVIMSALLGDSIDKQSKIDDLRAKINKAGNALRNALNQS